MKTNRPRMPRRDLDEVLSTVQFEPDSAFTERLHARLLRSIPAAVHPIQPTPGANGRHRPAARRGNYTRDEEPVLMSKSRLIPAFAIGLIAVLAVALAVVVLPRQSGTASPAADPAAVVQAAFEALNAGDIDTMMSYYADDALLIDDLGTWEGKEAIRRHYVDNPRASGDVQITPSNFRVEGDVVYYSYRITRNGNFVTDGDDGLMIVVDGRILYDGVAGRVPQDLLAAHLSGG